jgi:hypothetical protein
VIELAALFPVEKAVFAHGVDEPRAEAEARVEVLVEVV